MPYTEEEHRIAMDRLLDDINLLQLPAPPEPYPPHDYDCNGCPADL